MSALTYPLGTVAMAAVRGESSYRVMLVDGPLGPVWVHSITESGNNRSGLDEVTNIRPLVTLDPDLSDVSEFLRIYGNGHEQDAWAARRFARFIAEQIEAQTKPPRIPEPGWSGVVEAGVEQHSVRLKWQRQADGYWQCSNPDEYDRNWGELVDPVLVRDGIEDQS